MERKSGSDDYVRIPLPTNGDAHVESDSELAGVIEQDSNMQQQHSSNSTPNAWNFDFYRQHFDVDTPQVLRRLGYAMFPNPRTNFSQSILKPNADLYGPFWIATTLILTAAVGGNVSSYLQSRGRVTSWHYDFKKVTLASTIIYAYWWLVPLGLVAFFYIRLRKTQQTAAEDQDPLLHEQGSGHSPSGISTRGFIQLLSIYGYSLAVFVPVAILWTIPSPIFQWLLVAIAMLISGAFLTFALFPTLLREHRKLAGPLVMFIVLLHCLFSVSLMLTFFYGSVPTVTNPAVAPESALPNPVGLDKVKRSVQDLSWNTNTNVHGFNNTGHALAS